MTMRSGGRSPTSEEIEEWRRHTKPAPPRRRAATDEKSQIPPVSGVAAIAEPRPAGGRQPSRNELRDWTNVIEGNPLSPEPAVAKPPPARPRQPAPLAGPNAGSRINAFEIGAAATPEPAVQYEDPDRKSSGQPAATIDRRIKRRLKSGKIEPERIIDLHGMNRDRAERYLLRFLKECFAARVRLALVVTGKGYRSPTDPNFREPGVLRQSVPVWLQRKPLSEIVQHVQIAHAAHGGGGAYYVYLRQARKVQTAAGQ